MGCGLFVISANSFWSKRDGARDMGAGLSVEARGAVRAAGRSRKSPGCRGLRFRSRRGDAPTQAPCPPAMAVRHGRVGRALALSDGELPAKPRGDATRRTLHSLHGSNAQHAAAPNRQGGRHLGTPTIRRRKNGNPQNPQRLMQRPPRTASLSPATRQRTPRAACRPAARVALGSGSTQEAPVVAAGALLNCQAGWLRSRLHGGEVLLRALGVGLHGLVTGLPAGGADLVGVGLHVLDGLQHALGLVDAAAERQVAARGERSACSRFWSSWGQKTSPGPV